MTEELSIIEQLAIVSQQGHCEFQTVLMWVCVFALAALGVFFGLLFLGKACKAYVDRLKRHGRIGGLLLGALTVYMILYGGTKPQGHIWAFQFSNGLTDNGSYCTNNQIRAIWTATPVLLDGNYAVKMAWQNATMTNSVGTILDPWHTGEDARVADLQATWNVPNATNMHVMVWAEYVAPVVVHTNGVYKIGNIMREMGGTQKYMTPAMSITVTFDNGTKETITPTNRQPQSLLQALVNEITGENEQ